MVDFIQSWGTSANYIDVSSRPPPASTVQYREATSVQISKFSTAAVDVHPCFVGSLVLEVLLRCCPQVKQVYLLVRSKRGTDPAHRVRKLLDSNIFLPFNQMPGHEQQAAKVCPIAADITYPQLGIDGADLHMLARQVTIIIHSASAIQFDMTVTAALDQVFCPTKALLQIAQECTHLHKFVYISTAFANSNLPKGSRVQEIIYPLHSNGARVDGVAVAERLCTLSAKEAQTEGTALMEKWHFKNTYYLVKNLTERLVAAAHREDLSTCIVRPSIVGAVSVSPVPGYIGNSSGATGGILAYGTGILSSYAHDPDSIFSIVPGDVVAANILLAATTQNSSPTNSVQIVQVCTSSTFPITTCDFITAGVRYFQDDPVLKARVLAGKHRDMVWMSDAKYKRACFWRNIRVALLTSMMKRTGKSRLGDKVSAGWQASRDLGSSMHDYDLVFECQNQKAMVRECHSADAQTKTDFKLVFSPASGDAWGRYVRTYAAGARHRFLKEAPVASASHDYSALLVTDKAKQGPNSGVEKLKK